MAIFDNLKQAKKLMELRSQQKKLAQLEVTFEEQGIKVIVSGDQKIKFLSINGQEDKRLVEVLNKALKKSQKMVAKQAQDVLGDLLGLK